MKIRFAVLASLAFLAIAAVPASATETDYFTGAVFSSAESPLTTSENISAAFTFTTPLSTVNGGTGHNEASDVSSWTISDGNQIYSSTSPGGTLDEFNVDSDSTGNITNYWQVDVMLIGGGEIHFASVGVTKEYVFNIPGYSSGFEATTGGTGSWSLTAPSGGSVSATPEPGSITLFSTGLLSMAGVVRKRFKA